MFSGVSNSTKYKKSSFLSRTSRLTTLVQEVYNQTFLQFGIGATTTPPRPVPSRPLPQSNRRNVQYSTIRYKNSIHRYSIRIYCATVPVWLKQRITTSHLRPHIRHTHMYNLRQIFQGVFHGTRSWLVPRQILAKIVAAILDQPVKYVCMYGHT